MEIKLLLLKKTNQYSIPSILFPTTLLELIKFLFNIPDNPHSPVLDLANEPLAIWKGVWFCPTAVTDNTGWLVHYCTQVQLLWSVTP